MDSTDSQAVEIVDLAGLVRPVFARWKLLLVLTLVGAVAGFVISILLPRIYQSQATIYAKQSRGASSLLGGLPIALGVGSSTPSSYYTALLQSETMLRGVITRLDLIRNSEFDGGRKLSMEKAIRLLSRSANVRENRSGAVEITVKSTDPYLAARIGNAMLDGLSGMVVTSSRRKVTFISGRLKETTADLRKAEDEMRGFMESNDIAAIEEQTKALVLELSELDARLLALDVEAEELASRLSNAGELDSLVDDEVRKRAIESSRGVVLEKRAELQEKLTHLPDLATKYARLQRRIISLNKTYEILTEQYQLERITQQGEDGDYQVIDRASPNRLKVSPRRGVNTAAGGLLGFIVAAVAASALGPVRKHKKGY